MATIRAYCPKCGDVAFTANNQDNPQQLKTKQNAKKYRFKCPCCSKWVKKKAKKRTIVFINLALKSPPARPRDVDVKPDPQFL